MPKWLLVLAALFAVYFPVAWSLKASHEVQIPKGRTVVQIVKPFTRDNHAAIPWQFGLERFAALGDNPHVEGDKTSPIALYEDGKELGPAHSTFKDIYHLGGGRFSHLKGRQFVFSTSDNSDPNTNGRAYWVVLP